MSSSLQAAIFDMDGVITQTAPLHAAAWKETFDDFLRRRACDGVPFQPFDERAEYHAYVDGKPGLEGVRSFLLTRQISLDEEEEVALAMIAALRTRDVKTGVVTSSRPGREILQSSGIATLFDARLDEPGGGATRAGGRALQRATQCRKGNR